MTEADLRTAVEDLEALCEEIRLIDVDATLASEAGELAERHALRGYDAVHLATALSLAHEEVVVVTWDEDLGNAAVQAGRATVPGAPPADDTDSDGEEPDAGDAGES